MQSSKLKIIITCLHFLLLIATFNLALYSPELSKDFALHVSSTYAAATKTNNAQILRVNPFIINIPLSPGHTYRYPVTVENLSQVALPLRASTNDFITTGEEGGYTFENTRTNPLLSWISLSDTDIILNPKEKKDVVLTIKTPNQIPLGGYYGMLFFETVPQMNTITQTQVVSRIGVLMLANVGVADPHAKKAEITTFSTGFLQQNSTLPLLLRVKNISLHFFTAKPILTISPLIHLPNYESKPIYLEEKIVFQDKIRRWQQEIPLGNAGPNIYKAVMKVSTGGGQYITAINYFVIFPLTPAIIIVLVLIVLIFHRRLIRAINALFQV